MGSKIQIRMNSKIKEKEKRQIIVIHQSKGIFEAESKWIKWATCRGWNEATARIGRFPLGRGAMNIPPQIPAIKRNEMTNSNHHNKKKKKRRTWRRGEELEYWKKKRKKRRGKHKMRFCIQCGFWFSSFPGRLDPLEWKYSSSMLTVLSSFVSPEIILPPSLPLLPSPPPTK